MIRLTKFAIFGVFVIIKCLKSRKSPKLSKTEKNHLNSGALRSTQKIVNELIQDGKVPKGQR